MAETIKNIEIIAGVITACITIFGVPFGLHRWYSKWKSTQIKKAQKAAEAEKREDRQDSDIAQMKEENCLIMYGLSACLDGLIQQGCNHTVPDAKEKIDKYLNKMAHK